MPLPESGLLTCTTPSTCAMPETHSSTHNKALVTGVCFPVACPHDHWRKKQENSWHLFAEGIPDIFVQLSRDGTILHINRTPIGLSSEDVLGKNVFDLLVPASRPTLRRALDEVFLNGDSRVHEIPILGDDGRIWFAAHVRPSSSAGES